MAETEKTQTANQAAEEEEEVPPSTEDRVKVLEEVVTELIDKIEALEKNLKSAGVKPKGLFGGKRQRVPTKDLKTGVVYQSKAAIGKEFAAEVGADPLDSMAYYKVIGALKMDDKSERFVDASPDEATKAIAEMEARNAKEVEELNAKIQAEEANKAATQAQQTGGKATDAKPKPKNK